MKSMPQRTLREVVSNTWRVISFREPMGSPGEAAPGRSGVSPKSSAREVVSHDLVDALVVSKKGGMHICVVEVFRVGKKKTEEESSKPQTSLDSLDLNTKDDHPTTW